MDETSRDALALQFAQMACDAGEIVMASARTASSKPDGSPVTDADRNAEKLIRERLRSTEPALVVIAEESFDAGARQVPPARFALVDPLDGTREFVRGGDEFTINIALIENGKPTVACVFAPARGRMYVAGSRAMRADVAPGSRIASAAFRPIATAPYPAGWLRAVMSRSHPDPDTARFIARLPVTEHLQIGSSLKFCLLAEGSADVYPRLAPTMEWDTAAGHAVLAAAGGKVLARDGTLLRYGKPGFRNDGFVAWGRDPLPAS